jgi:glycerol uptake facilitator-like aquaporin
MTRHQALREVAGELLGTGLLVLVAFASGAVRVQLGAGTMAGALLGSLALGLGYGLVLWSVGPLSGAQTNPLVSVIASVIGHQRWTRTLLRVLSQVLGAAATGLVLARAAPHMFVRDNSNIAPNLLGEAVASFAFVLVALGVAHRRDVTVPVALGAIASASFWMTGRATVGNPLLSFTILIVADDEFTTWTDVLQAGASDLAGALFAVVVALFLFPHARESASALLFVPQRAKG